MLAADEEAESAPYAKEGPARKRVHDETPGESQNTTRWPAPILGQSREMQLPLLSAWAGPNPSAAVHPPQPLVAGQLGSSSSGLVNESYLQTNHILRQLHEARLRRTTRE
jgi:hypothetical protein